MSFIFSILVTDDTVMFQEGPRTFVGIATFDTTIHFYNLKRALQQVTFQSLLSISILGISFVVRVKRKLRHLDGECNNWYSSDRWKGNQIISENR